MKRKTQNFALGVASIVFFALFLATFLFLYPALRQGGGKTILIEFPHEEGMAPITVGSPVMLGDAVGVGQVSSIWFEQRKPTPASPTELVFMVKIQVRQDLPLYGDADVTTNQPPVGGGGYVSINYVGTPGVPLVQPLKGRPPESLSATIAGVSRRLLSRGGLLDKVSDAGDPNVQNSIVHKMLVSLDDVNAITRELRTQMNPGEQQSILTKIQLVLDNFNAMTTAVRGELNAGNSAAALAKLHVALDQLDSGLAEATGIIKGSAPLIHDSLASGEHATRTVDRDVIGNVRAELDANNPGSLLATLHTSAERVNSGLAAFETLMGDARSLVALNRPVIDQAVANFRDMSERLRQASQEILLNPSILLKGPGKREQQLVIFQAASSFAEAAGQLDNAVTRLQAMLNTLPAEGRLSPEQSRELRAIFDSVRATFQQFGQAENTLWQEMK